MPDEAETLNGVKDEDGCPDPGAAIVQLPRGASRWYRKSGLSAARASGDQGRDAGEGDVRRGYGLKGHPEIRRLRIELHAEAVGRDETQRRAEVVRDFLVSKGVETGRLIPVGAGAGPSQVDFIVDKRRARRRPGSAAARGRRTAERRRSNINSLGGRRPHMRIIGWGASDVGRKRNHNEDSYLCNNDIGIYAVADGMGGHLGESAPAAWRWRFSNAKSFGPVAAVIWRPIPKPPVRAVPTPSGPCCVER